MTGRVLDGPWPTDTATSAISAATESAGVRITESTTPRIDPRDVPIEDLYPGLNQASPFLARALNLLQEANTSLETALVAENILDAADELHRLQAMMTELFVLRSIGDGFASVVSSVQLALQNHEGAMSKQQLLALRFVLRSIANTPFIGFDNSLNLTEKLEAAGLLIYPPQLDALAKLPE